jgi:hypothetical protein
VQVHKVKVVLKDKANQRVNANLSAVNSIELE